VTVTARQDDEWRASNSTSQLTKYLWHLKSDQAISAETAYTARVQLES
jgi:hypothetical protein